MSVSSRRAYLDENEELCLLRQMGWNPDDDEDDASDDEATGEADLQCPESQQPHGNERGGISASARRRKKKTKSKAGLIVGEAAISAPCRKLNDYLSEFTEHPVSSSKTSTTKAPGDYEALAEGDTSETADTTKSLSPGSQCHREPPADLEERELNAGAAAPKAKCDPHKLLAQAEDQDTDVKKLRETKAKENMNAIDTESQKKGRTVYIVNKDFEEENSKYYNGKAVEMSVRVGEMVQVERFDAEWWYCCKIDRTGQNTSERGWVPECFLSVPSEYASSNRNKLRERIRKSAQRRSGVRR